MGQRKIVRLSRLGAVAGLALWICASTALAEGDKPSAGAADPAFGSRKQDADGSVALTIGRRLPTEWETKIGTDLRLAEPASAVPSENFLRGTTSDQSSGEIWGNVTMPGLPPLGWDKTLLEGRIDAGKDEGKLGATLSRSVPIDETLSLTLQNSYSVTHSIAPVLSDSGVPASVAPLTASAPASATSNADASAIWAAGQTVRLNIAPSGTALSAGATASSADDQWHNKLSLEQTLFGPLKITTSVEDTGRATSKQSIVAGFKRSW
jgi:hypothetical protein